jgi:hypothetical protein
MSGRWRRTTSRSGSIPIAPTLGDPSERRTTPRRTPSGALFMSSAERSSPASMFVWPLATSLATRERTRRFPAASTFTGSTTRVAPSANATTPTSSIGRSASTRRSTERITWSSFSPCIDPETSSARTVRDGARSASTGAPLASISIARLTRASTSGRADDAASQVDSRRGIGGEPIPCESALRRRAGSPDLTRALWRRSG